MCPSGSILKGVLDVGHTVDSTCLLVRITVLCVLSPRPPVCNIKPRSDAELASWDEANAERQIDYFMNTSLTYTLNAPSLCA